MQIYRRMANIQGNLTSLMIIISAVTCLESRINMIIDKHPTKSEYKKLNDLKKKGCLVNNHFNI